MSAHSYNALLKAYPNKGLAGDEERVEGAGETAAKVDRLAALFAAAKHAVFFTGAGLSTAAGVPDFRGTHGVWTRELQGLPPPAGKSFREARPTAAHRVVARMLAEGRAAYVVSQNVDALHLRSGVPREQLSELHGNVCMEKCRRCGREYLRDGELGSVGCRPTGRACEDEACGGPLHDTALDWDGELPDPDYSRAIEHCRRADLIVCLGTSLRIRPAGNMPMRCVRRNGKPEPGRLVIVNLQSTHLDRHCELRFHAKCDDVMTALADRLGVRWRDDGGGGGGGAEHGGKRAGQSAAPDDGADALADAPPAKRAKHASS